MKTSVLYLMLMVFGLLLFGCSKGVKSIYGNNNNGSNGGPVEVLNCIKNNGTLIPARLETDLSSASYVTVKFTAHPADFDEANTSIRFFSGIDTSSISSTSAAYIVYYSPNGMMLGSSPSGGDLDREYLDDLASSLDLTDLTFQVNVGPNARVLRISMRQDTSTLEQTTSLIPAVDANPNSYATNHPQSLVNLHPLLPYSNSGWTNYQYRQQGEHLCSL